MAIVACGVVSALTPKTDIEGVRTWTKMAGIFGGPRCSVIPFQVGHETWSQMCQQQVAFANADSMAV